MSQTYSLKAERSHDAVDPLRAHRGTGLAAPYRGTCRSLAVSRRSRPASPTLTWTGLPNSDLYQMLELPGVAFKPEALTQAGHAARSPYPTESTKVWAVPTVSNVMMQIT